MFKSKNQQQQQQNQKKKTVENFFAKFSVFPNLSVTSHKYIHCLCSIVVGCYRCYPSMLFSCQKYSFFLFWFKCVFLCYTFSFFSSWTCYDKLLQHPTQIHIFPKNIEQKDPYEILCHFFFTCDNHWAKARKRKKKNFDSFGFFSLLHCLKMFGCIHFPCWMKKVKHGFFSWNIFLKLYQTKNTYFSRMKHVHFRIFFHFRFSISTFFEKNNEISMFFSVETHWENKTIGYIQFRQKN